MFTLVAGSQAGVRGQDDLNKASEFAMRAAGLCNGAETGEPVRHAALILLAFQPLYGLARTSAHTWDRNPVGPEPLGITLDDLLVHQLGELFPDYGPRPDSIEPQLVTGALHAEDDLRARRVHQDQEIMRIPSPILSRAKNLDANIYKVPYL